MRAVINVEHDRAPVKPEGVDFLANGNESLNLRRDGPKLEKKNDGPNHRDGHKIYAAIPAEKFYETAMAGTERPIQKTPVSIDRSLQKGLFKRIGFPFLR